MMNLSQDELDSLIEILVLSNTPSYLYRRMSELPLVRHISDGVSEVELARIYRTLGSKRRKSAIDNAIAYAALMALLMKTEVPNRKRLERLAAVPLEWGKSLLTKFLSRPFTSTSLEMTIPPTIRVASPGVPRRVETTSQIIDVTPKNAN